MNIKFKEFSDKIYYSNIEVNKNLLDLLHEVKLENFEYNSNNYYNNYDLHLTEKIFSSLKETIFEYLKILNLKKFEVIKWWLQKYKKNQFHDLHTHGTEKNYFSFILYLDCSEKSSVVNFFNALYPYIFNQKISFKPEKNLFVFFPSFIPHSVDLNTDEKRFILSANLKCYE
jgi:hypothetical protein